MPSWNVLWYSAAELQRGGRYRVWVKALAEQWARGGVGVPAELTAYIFGRQRAKKQNILQFDGNSVKKFNLRNTNLWSQACGQNGR